MGENNPTENTDEKKDTMVNAKYFDTPSNDFLHQPSYLYSYNYHL